MAALDVWGDSWLASWGVSWAAATESTAKVAAPDYRPKFYKAQNPLIRPEPDEFDKAVDQGKPRPKLRLVKPVDVPDKIVVAAKVAQFNADSKSLLALLEKEEKARKLKQRIREQDLAFIMGKILEM